MGAAGVVYPDSLLEWVTGTQISKLIPKPISQAAASDAPEPFPSLDIKAARIDTKQSKTNNPEKKAEEGVAKAKNENHSQSKKCIAEISKSKPSGGRTFTLQLSETEYGSASSSSEGYPSRTTKIRIVRKNGLEKLKPALISVKGKSQKEDKILKKVGFIGAEELRPKPCLRPSGDTQETRLAGEQQGNRCVDALTRENTLKNRGIRPEFLEIRSPLVGQRVGVVVGREVLDSQYITHDRSQGYQNHQNSSDPSQKQCQMQNQHSTQDSCQQPGKLGHNNRTAVSVGMREGRRPNSNFDSAHPNQRTNQSTQHNSNNAKIIHHQPNSKQTRQIFTFQPLIMQGQGPQIIQPVRAEVIMREDVIEGPSDPRPNAFYCAKTGVLRVYHGPQYGNPYATILPHPPMLIGTYPPHAGQFMGAPTQIPGGPPPLQTPMPTPGPQYHAQPHGSSTVHPQPMNFNANNNNNQRQSSGSNVHFNSPRGESQPQAAPGTPNNGWQTLTQEEADNMMQGAMPGGWVNDGPPDNDNNNGDGGFDGNRDNYSGSGWNNGDNNENSGNDNSGSAWNDNNNNQNSGNNNSGSGWNDNNQNSGNGNGMSAMQSNTSGNNSNSNNNNNGLSWQNSGGNNSKSNFNKSPSWQNNLNGNNSNTNNGPGNSPATSWQNNSGNNNQNSNNQPQNSPPWQNQGGNKNNQNSSNRNTPRQNNCTPAKPWQNGNNNNQSSQRNSNGWNGGNQDSTNDSSNNNHASGCGGGWNNDNGNSSGSGGWNNDSNDTNGNNDPSNNNNSGSSWGNDASNNNNSGGGWSNNPNGNGNNSGDNFNNSWGNNDNSGGGWDNNSSNNNKNSRGSWNNNSNNNNCNGGNNNSEEKWGAPETPAAWGDMSAAQGGNNNNANNYGTSGWNNNSGGGGWNNSNNDNNNSHGRGNSFSMGGSKDKPWQTETVISAGSWGDGGTGPTGPDFNNSKNSGGW